jgi:hypothetical protein
MRAQVHRLNLVYPPISNQEAEWLKNDEETVNWVKESKIYFIGQKPECWFEFPENMEQYVYTHSKILFSFHNIDFVERGSIDIDLLIKFHEIDDERYDNIEVEVGRKFIRIWVIKGESREVLDWFTTEKILYNVSRKSPYLNGICDYRNFTKYILHYIGISKKQDSFSRLVIKPHDKRLRILSNESSFSTKSRLTDELILFFFDIESIEVKQLTTLSDFVEMGKNELGDRTKIFVDAEKAFVKVLNTNYNEVKFKDYPYSKDGLYNSTVDKYSFSINEDIEFMTKDNVIYGDRAEFGFNENLADFISIDKESSCVDLIKLKRY